MASTSTKEEPISRKEEGEEGVASSSKPFILL